MPVAAAISGSSTVARNARADRACGRSRIHSPTPTSAATTITNRRYHGKTTSPASTDPRSSAGYVKRERVAAPDHERGITKQQRKPHRHHHLGERVGAESPKKESLHDEPDGADDHDRDDGRRAADSGCAG